jgi:hypothetical protein
LTSVVLATAMHDGHSFLAPNSMVQTVQRKRPQDSQTVSAVFWAWKKQTASSAIAIRALTLDGAAYKAEKARNSNLVWQARHVAFAWP